MNFIAINSAIRGLLFLDMLTHIAHRLGLSGDRIFKSFHLKPVFFLNGSLRQIVFCLRFYLFFNSLFLLV